MSGKSKSCRRPKPRGPPASVVLTDWLSTTTAVGAASRPSASRAPRALVENEVQKLLPHGKAKRPSVAKTLGLSERTLTRKLADEGASYEQVVDQLRRSLALEYVKEGGLSLSQKAWLVGYEGSTSFNHAFRRWTGRSPSEARNEKRLPPPASA
jgi:AraC-like DNA-binding protein